MEKMLKFRRSAKSTKSQELKSPPISIPVKDAIAIQPPKKVIKAIYDFHNPSHDSNLLSFEQGDFLYVIGREHDPDWYEACNPQSGVRGLVPVNYFEEQGKHVKSTSNTLTSRSSGTGGHDSGYSEKSSDGGGMNGTGAGANGHNRLRSNAAKGMVIYGMVLFDFKAERTDELDAKAGEPIVVVAQSNSEWFVAKPITRLGGPGLIPVAFIEIRDSVTQKPVENTLEAVQRAGVPTVEEWKKMAADYKNSSIPLGRLDTTQTAPLQQTMQRLSIASSARPSHDTSRHGSDARQRQGSLLLQPQPSHRTSQMLSPVRAKVPSFTSTLGPSGDEKDRLYYFNVHAVMEDGRTWRLLRTYEDFYSMQLDVMKAFPREAGAYDPNERSIPFMPGPVPFVTPHLTSQRQALLDLYMGNLLKVSQEITTCAIVRGFFFPRQGDGEIGNEDRDSGYRQSISSRQSTGVRESRHESFTNGGTLPSLNQSSPLRPQPSSSSGESGQQPGYETGNTNNGNGNGNGNGNDIFLNQTTYPKSQHLQLHKLTLPSTAARASPPPVLRTESSLSIHSNDLSHSNSHPLPYPTSTTPQPQSQYPHQPGTLPNTTATANTTTATPTAKVKVWFGDTNCVVVRLPSDYNFAHLVSKLRERWALEQGAGREEAESVRLGVEWKDEGTGAFWEVGGDEELERAKERGGGKVVLRVGVCDDNR